MGIHTSNLPSKKPSGEGGSVEVINGLTSSKTDAALSAAMGKKLNDENVQIKQDVKICSEFNLGNIYTIDGYRLNTSGNVVEDANSIMSDYIDVINLGLKVHGQIYNAAAYAVFYDSGKNICENGVKTVTTTISDSSNVIEIKQPSNAVFARFSKSKTRDTYISAIKYSTVTDFYNEFKILNSYLPTISTLDNLLNIQSSDLNVGEYIPLTGTHATTTSNQPGFYSLSVPIIQGDIITIGTSGSATARAYALTDTAKKILTLTESGYDSTLSPDKLIAEVDGFLIINCKESGISKFTCNIKTSNIVKIENDIIRIENKSIGLQEQLNNANIYKSMDITPDLMTDGSYYNTSGTSSGNIIMQAGYSSIKIEVKSGAIVKVATNGGNAARAYALTNCNGLIYLKSDALYNCLDNPDTIDVTEDGYLIVHCTTATKSGLILNISRYNLEQDLNGVKKIVNDLNSLPLSYIKTFYNNPLPTNPNKLKILAIGNSFTDDGTSFLQDLINETSLINISVCRVVNGGKALDFYYNALSDNNTEMTLTSLNPTAVASKTGTLKEILAYQDWDIIIFQQLSNYAGQYNTIDPYLPTLAKEARKLCPNPCVCVGWQSTWAWSVNKQGGWITGSTQIEECEYIAKTASQVANYGVDIIIPSGWAVQNARKAESDGLITSYDDFTRDTLHLDYGVGRYVAACAWFESLIRPIYGIGIVGNTLRVSLSEEQLQTGTNVTDDNAVILQKCARNACIDRFNIDIE